MPSASKVVFPVMPSEEAFVPAFYLTKSCGMAFAVFAVGSVDCTVIAIDDYKIIAASILVKYKY